MVIGMVHIQSFIVQNIITLTGAYII